MKNYLLRDIPPALWRDVKTHAANQGVTVRMFILKLLHKWTPEAPAASRQPVQRKAER